MDQLVAVEDLTVRYGSHTALDDISVGWDLGVHAVLGPNGAGKSTLFKVLSGVLRPSTGKILATSQAITTAKDMRHWQRSIGYLPQDPGWPDTLTVRELLSYFGVLRGLARRAAASRADEIIELVDLGEKKATLIAELSGGQRRRLFIGQAVIHDPKTVILDEPTAGLDPVQRIGVRDLMIELGRTKTLLVSTHMVEDVTQSATDIVVLDRGRLAWRGTPADLERLGMAYPATHANRSPHELGFLSVLEAEG